VVKDSGTGLPVAYRDIPGQITDVTLVKHLIAAFKLLGAAKPKACMDRGFYSEANVNALIDAHVKFIIAVPFTPTWAGQAVKEHATEVKRWANWDKDLGVYAARYDHPWERTVKDPATGAKTVETKRAYLHVFYNPERAIAQAHRLEVILSELHAELTAGKRDPGHESLYERYFAETKTRWEGREDVIDAERARAGWQVLISNDAHLTAAQALRLYRSKDQIEKAFHDVKDRLDFRTPKVHSHQALSGKLLIVFAALVLTSELRRRIGAAGLSRTWTMRGILDELESVERYEHDGRQPVVCHLTKKQRDLYRDLGAKPPA
jgi:transposase